MTADNRHR